MTYSAQGDAPAVHFLHIPKTAGTSVTEWLMKYAAPGRMCPAKNWDQLVRAAAVHDFSQDRLFCGHYGWGLDDFVGFELLTVTVLRDPLTRTYSHYRHVVRDSSHPYHASVRGASFTQFLRDPANLPMIENFQARYFVRTPLDTRAYVGHLDDDPAKQNMLSTTTESARYLLDRTSVREAALEALGKVAVLGVTSDIAGFLRAVARRLDLAASATLDVPCVNVAPPDIESLPITSEDMALVRSLTTIDQELFEIAASQAGLPEAS